MADEHGDDGRGVHVHDIERTGAQRFADLHGHGHVPGERGLRLGARPRAPGTRGEEAARGLDVREQEPPTDRRFDGFPNVILSPHTAGITHQTISAMSHMAVDSILSGWRGESPHGLLTPAAWERRRPY